MHHVGSLYILTYDARKLEHKKILSDSQGLLRRDTQTSTSVGEDDCIDGCGTQLKCAEFIRFIRMREQ